MPNIYILYGNKVFDSLASQCHVLFVPGDKHFSNTGEGGGQTFRHTRVGGKDFKTEGGGQTKIFLKGKV